jgi:hypothetical protein
MRYASLVDTYQDVIRLQMFGSTEREAFHIMRNLQDGQPVAVATTGTAFSPYSKDMAARLLTVDTLTNLPIKIDTWKIEASEVDAKTDDELANVVVSLDHSFPLDLWGRDNLISDLGPSSYAALVDYIRRLSAVASSWLQGSAMGERDLKLSIDENATCKEACSSGDCR